jgi:hypothetical protein
MFQVESEFSDGVINAKSTHSTYPNEVWEGHFDFALIGTSWDKRCLALTSCKNLKFESVVEITPREENADQLLISHHRVLGDYLRQCSTNYYLEESITSKLSETYAEVRKRFLNAIGNPDRRLPARVFIDVSTCPRFFSLAILGEAFRSGVVGEIVVGYSEGKYPDATPSYEDLEDISFTDGSFNAMPIPGFFGEFEPSKGVLFLVSTGFDGWKTLNLLIRKEPDRVAVLIASPGVSPDYERRSNVANKPLVDRFGILDSEIVKARAGDAVQAWRKISEAGVENFEKENVFYLCSGNKAHSVALALRAIATQTPTLLYNRPEKHLPGKVECAGLHWAYSIMPSIGTVLG